MKRQQARHHADIQHGTLDFFAQPTAMTAAGRHAQTLDKLPSDIAELARIIQGLAVHQYMADAYGFDVPEERKAESHIRSAERILDRILELDDRPLATARPVERRVVGVCHHFSLLQVALLRAKGIPARYRCGFGAFFNAPYFEEHVTCEYWNADEARWVLADAQLDEVWKRALKFDFDPLDVPRTQFLVAADAWIQCRTGKADPAKFGIFAGNLRGLWFIAAELVRDLAALNKAEVLPWDVWGAMPQPGEQLGTEQLAFFDRLAALTSEPDASFAELTTLYESDQRLRVPPTVFNLLLNRPETV
jgi:hypothetical protein